MRALVFLFLLWLSQLNLFGQTIKETTVYFDLGIDTLTVKEKEKLNTWLNQLPDSILKFEVRGYADFVGNEEANLLLSKLRSDAVLSAIENRVKPRFKLSLVNFEGENNSVPNGSVFGVIDDRKVEIRAFYYPPLNEQKEELVMEEVFDKEPKPQVVAPSQLTEVEIGESIVLENLNFHGGRHYLVPAALPELEKLIEVMKQNPTLEIEIQGHICCKLTADDGFDLNTQTYNLSTNRAKYIYDQLALAGIEESRMKYKGFAGSNPLVYPEKNHHDSNRNRRVEIQVLKK